MGWTVFVDPESSFRKVVVFGFHFWKSGRIENSVVESCVDSYSWIDRGSVGAVGYGGCVSLRQLL